MNKEFCTYKQALTLKELGFNEPCLAQYKKYEVGEAKLDIGFSKNELIMQFHKLSKFCTAPLYQQAFRWFREKYDKYGVVNIDLSNNLKDEIFVYMVEDKLGYIIDRSEEYKTYEEAEQACLDKLIEIVKNGK